jgi:ABC-type bacteriocin/lantibiotic exporter with double-glycine peptidase domain
MRFALDQGDRLITSYLFARSSHFRVLMRQMAASLALQVIASTVLLGLGGWLVIRGELTLGQLVAAELIVTVILGSFAKIAKYLESYYDVLASVDKLGHLLDMPMERCDGIELQRQSSGITLSTHDLVTQELPSGQRINNASLLVNSGERVALVGSNSGLRGLLVRTIAGMQPAVSGRVEFDNIDLWQLKPGSLHDQIAVVAEPEVFEGTIAENILLGRLGVAESDMRSALQCVGLLDEFLNLPQGLSTLVKTDGRQFSRDQLVRLMLARAIAAKPRLLLIEGAIDVLPDSEIADVVFNALHALPNCTCIVSTGRRQVAESCQRQIAIDADGRVHEGPAHKEPTSITRP